MINRIKNRMLDGGYGTVLSIQILIFVAIGLAFPVITWIESKGLELPALLVMLAIAFYTEKDLDRLLEKHGINNL